MPVTTWLTVAKNHYTDAVIAIAEHGGSHCPECPTQHRNFFRNGKYHSFSEYIGVRRKSRIASPVGLWDNRASIPGRAKYQPP